MLPIELYSRAPYVAAMPTLFPLTTCDDSVAEKKLTEIDPTVAVIKNFFPFVQIKLPFSSWHRNRISHTLASNAIA